MFLQDHARRASIASLIHRALPGLSFRTRALVDALLLTGGGVGTAGPIASHLGLRSRFQLAALLHAEGLPSLHRLSGWMTVLRWTWEWKHEATSLCRAALRTGKEPATNYRLVKRITGVPWVKVRAAGVDWVLARFLDECSFTNLQHPSVPHPVWRATAPPWIDRAPMTRNCTRSA